MASGLDKSVLKAFEEHVQKLERDMGFGGARAKTPRTGAPEALRGSRTDMIPKTKGI